MNRDEALEVQYKQEIVMWKGKLVHIGQLSMPWEHTPWVYIYTLKKGSTSGAMQWGKKVLLSEIEVDSTMDTSTSGC